MEHVANQIKGKAGQPKTVSLSVPWMWSILYLEASDWRRTLEKFVWSVNTALRLPGTVGLAEPKK